MKELGQSVIGQTASRMGKLNSLPQPPAVRSERNRDAKMNAGVGWAWRAREVGGWKSGLQEVNVSSEISSLKSMSLSFDLMIWSNMIVSLIPVYVLTVNLCYIQN